MSDELIYQKIGPYRIQERIGFGGMGIVYRAIDEELKREVAIKFIHEGFVLHKEAIDQFIHEARTSAKLDHENVLGIITMASHEGRHYIVMPYLSGGSLEDRLKREGPMKEKEALDLLLAIAEGLQAAHQAGILHQDVKPENILFGKDGKIKISDFGLAAMQNKGGETESLQGTPYTMSPEQCLHKKLDVRSDIYSLGITFFRMLTGCWPFDGEVSLAVIYQHLHEKIPEKLLEGRHLSANVIYLIRKMTEKDRNKRYENMKSLIHDIHLCLKKGSVIHRREDKKNKKKYNFYPWIFILLALGGGLKFWKSFPKNSNVPQKNLNVKHSFEKTKDPKKEPQRSRHEIIQDIEGIKRELYQNDKTNHLSKTEIYELLEKFSGFLAVLDTLLPGDVRHAALLRELDDLRVEWLPYIANSIIDPLLNIEQPKRALERLSVLPVQLLRLPRLAQFYFDMIDLYFNLSLEERQKENLEDMARYLYEAWRLHLSPMIKASLFEKEEKLRNFKRELKLEEYSRNDKIRFFNLWQLVLRRIQEGFLEDAKIILKFLALHRDHYEREEESRDLLILFQRQKERYERQQMFPLSFDRAMALNQNDLARNIQKEWAKENRCRASDKAWVALRVKVLFDELRKEKKTKGNPEKILEIGSRVLRLSASMKELEEILKQALSEAGGDKERVWEDYLECSRLYGQGKFEELEIRLENISRSFQGMDLIFFRDRIKKWRQCWKWIEKGRPEKILEVLKQSRKDPALQKIFRYLLSRAHLDVAKRTFQNGQMKEAWKAINQASFWFGEDPRVVKNREMIFQALAQRKLEALTLKEKEANQLFNSGKLEMAIDCLNTSLTLAGSEEFFCFHPDLRQLFFFQKQRLDDLKRLSAALSRVKVAFEEKDWEKAFKEIIVIEREHGHLDSLIFWRKRLNFNQALEKLKLAKTPRKKLENSWRAFENQPEETDYFQAHQTLRKELFEEMLRQAEVQYRFIESLVQADDIQKAQSIFDKVMDDLVFFQQDLKREPLLQNMESFEKIFLKWQKFSERLRQLEYEKAEHEKSLGKFKELSEKAAQFEKIGKLDQAVEALKNSRLHASHLSQDALEKLQRRIENLERRLPLGHLESSLEETAESGEMEKIIFQIRKNEEEWLWEKALAALEKLEKKVGDRQWKVPGESENIFEWELRLKRFFQDEKDYRELQTRIEKFPLSEKLKELKRFIRLNSGNLYVTRGKVQEEIENLQILREKDQQRQKELIFEEIKKLAEEGNYPEAEAKALKALNERKSLLLQELLVKLLHEDRIFFKGGKMRMGREPGEDVSEEESPPFETFIRAFYMARYEVCNLQYLRFVEKGGGKAPESWLKGHYLPGQEYDPVQGVSLEDARAYARWVGARLPTEMEWEWAAKGGNTLRRWPWGNDRDKTLANVETANGRLDSIFSNPEGVSRQGLFNMAGNVSEWTTSPYYRYDFYLSDENEKSDEWFIRKNSHVLRGGSLFDKLIHARVTSRKGLPADKHVNGVGFRLCWDVE
jgi:serine/threonine protein kinase/formylglycine-generating enzyme required for sulfatase activity